MCIHGIYAGETASGDQILMDCPRCEQRRDWADEDERDRIDEQADFSGIRDEYDRWD